mmetsp:Transcript_21414/g.59820  ORF Transcript_21414/g.59820 Transcript_21414/m.59820 type:complete len:399 (-) Transcript_21414:59-1255(-)|eukprot:CAMPEP_0117485704 /NCGR_PEP_ID=MMETSP0784-20121206/15101_1 /TAXON_ID=39447 /ORGANISM="" /LENGTH=398 /DNA_ID=CAMNT_0005280297 /DNA_START=46 /DNA_END=1242 /DNA_ORIENTATION=+
MLDLLLAAVLYSGLLFLFVWRLLFDWPTEKSWKDWVNYITLLYILISGIYVVEFVELGVSVLRDVHTNAENAAVRPPMVLRVLAIASPVAVFLTISLAWYQSRSHMKEIRSGNAVLQHDRALNIIALPGVYSVIIMGGAASVYNLMWEEMMGRDTKPGWGDHKAMVFASYETCVFVADMYEAWALYQFGALASEKLEESIGQDTARAHSSGNKKPIAVVSISAVANVMWVGLSLFGVVCGLQAGVALYFWFFKIYGSTKGGLTEYEGNLHQFHLAGMVASAAAIYNVHKFESTFGHFIDGFAPFFKFLSVKAIVFFAFWQEGVLKVLRIVGIIPVTEVQLKLLQATLMTIECFFCGVMHYRAWHAQEVWYTDNDGDATSERKPILASSSSDTNPFPAA